MLFYLNYYTFVFSLINAVLARKLDVSLDVPKNVISGSSITFFCRFTCPLEEIYTIKWYRQGLEFFRYSPSENPPIKVLCFFKGCNVDEAESNATRVTLRNVSESLTGEFTCEVTSADDFNTVSNSNTLYVYDAKFLSKPKLKVELRIFNCQEFPTFLCSSIFMKEKNDFSNGFYVNNKTISSKSDLVKFDNKTGYLRLYVDKTPWKDEINTMVSCRSNLPGTVDLNSDEICFNCLSNTGQKLSITSILFKFLIWIPIVISICG